MNRVVLTGRFARDPELRFTGQGTPVATMTVAVDGRRSEDGKRRADFIRCVAWGKLGECIARYMKKGCLIGIEGRLQVGSYKDGDGVTRWTTEVVVSSAEFLERRREDAAASAAAAMAEASEVTKEAGGWRNTKYGVAVVFDDEDLPW